MHVILCDLCMYDHEERKKNRFISSKIKKKEVQKSEKKFQYLCPADDPHPDGLISKILNFFFGKKITHNELLKTRWNDI